MRLQNLSNNFVTVDKDNDHLKGQEKIPKQAS